MMRTHAEGTEYLDLGQRLVLAAKLAVARHQAQAAESAGESLRHREGRQVTIGGAGPHWITDDPKPSTRARVAGPQGL
jgi:hypothetical protein